MYRYSDICEIKQETIVVSKFSGFLIKTKKPLKKFRGFSIVTEIFEFYFLILLIRFILRL